jgi:hypothetical protein
MSLYCQGKHTPIAGKLALKVLEIIGEGGVIVPGNRWWWLNVVGSFEGQTFNPVEVTERSRVLFQEKFDVPIHDQLQLEAIISRATTLHDLDLDYSFLETSNLTGLRV